MVIVFLSSLLSFLRKQESHLKKILGSSPRKTVAVITLALILSGCTTAELVKSTFLSFTEDDAIGYYKLGKPYRVDKRWYFPKVETDYSEVGIASWYGSKFHRKLTANGERFDKNIASAAHKTLPIPSMLRVTNLENGKSILVRMNDRGPYAKDRIIDMSEKAAEQLGFREKGVVKVRVEFDAEETDKMFARGDHKDYKRPEAHRYQLRTANLKYPLTSDNGHFVQVGAYASYENAENASDALAEVGRVKIQEINLGAKTLYRVRLGVFDDIDDADNILEKVKKIGFGDAVIIAN